MSSDKYTWISTDRKSEAEVLKELAGADTTPVVLSRFDPASFAAGWQLQPTPLDPKHVIALLESEETRRDTAVSRLTQDWSPDLMLLVVPPSICSIIALGGADVATFTQKYRTTSLSDWLILRRLSQAKLHRFVIPSLPHNPILVPIRPALIFPKGGSVSTAIEKGITSLPDLVGAAAIDAIALRAGIYLWHDAMDESHELSQSIEGKGQYHNGDYLHAILHRREPDYGNAKYWFRHVGRHPNFERLGQEAGPLIEQHAPEWKSRLLKGGWDPFAFVDFCEQAVATKNPQWIACAEMIQEIELLLLLASTAARSSWCEHD